MEPNLKLKHELPKTLSGWLELAVEDAIACSTDRAYHLSMQWWHGRIKDSTKCHVCMAGAVLAKTCGADSREEIKPEDCYEYKGLKEGLYAINKMRVGDFNLAYDRLLNGVDTTGKRYDALAKIGLFVRNDFDKYTWRAEWETYSEAVTMLKEAGL